MRLNLSHGISLGFTALFASLLGVSSSTVSADDTEPVGLWTRWEATFEADTEADPAIEFQVVLTAPNSSNFTIPGFHDGGQTWKVRWMPSQTGRWRFATESKPSVAGLDGIEGTFECEVVESENLLIRHGALRVSKVGPYLEHADGTPFFWLGDTAWNGALLSEAEDWDRYLEDRRAKRFSAIQLVTTQWRTAATNLEGLTAYEGRETITINPAFFERMDERIEAVNAAGLLVAPVVLWSLGDVSETPGKLPTDQAIRLARYIVARYQGDHVLWFLGGDENYGPERADHWIQIGRAVFGEIPHAPVTLHPGGMQWKFEPFYDEPWLDVLIYQSGHGDDLRTLEWIHSGPPARAWRDVPETPIINSEPPYEGHVAYQSRQPHPAYNIRRASYWSLLSTPVAGITYGSHGVWSWEEDPAVPRNHNNSGIAPPWHEAIQRPGATQMGYLVDLFKSFPWWQLRPDPDLIVVQPEPDDPSNYIAAARTPEGREALVYLPRGGRVALRADRLVDDPRSSWFDPRNGETSDAKPEAVDDPKSLVFQAPSDQDWVLTIRR